MTALEQSLAYVEREIGFMIKDDLGLPTNGRFVDRVINDCLGFTNFGTGVYHSNKSTGMIFRAMNGPKGPSFMRFFNASLHDTRMDMVAVLVEADKFRLSKDKNSKNCRKYLIELYGKSVKRMRKVIRTAKDESFKSMYRGLKNFAQFDDFDDDDYDFGFSDVDFSGFDLDDITPGYRENTSMLSHKSADEIMAEIATEEARIGRKMTDSELDEFLSGPDEDDIPLNGTSGVNLGNIVKLVINELKASGSINIEPEKPLETLEEFLIKNKAPEIETVVPNSVDVEVPHHEVVDEKPQQKTELESLVGMYNHSEKESKAPETNHEDKKEESSESDDDESSQVPPVVSTGGTESSLATDYDYDDPHLYDSDGRFTEVTDEEVDNMFNKLLAAASAKAPPRDVDIQASIRKLEAQKAANPELVVEFNSKNMEEFVHKMKEKQAKEDAEREKKQPPQERKKSRRERRREERERRKAELRRAEQEATTLKPLREEEKVPVLPPSFDRIENEIDRPIEIEVKPTVSDESSEAPKQPSEVINHALLVEDIISEFDEVLKLKNELKFQMNNLCNSMKVPIKGMDIDIFPFQNVDGKDDVSYYLYNISIIIYPSVNMPAAVKTYADRLCTNFKEKVATALSLDKDKIYLKIKVVSPSQIKENELGIKSSPITPPELFSSFSPASLLFADDDSDEFHEDEEEDDDDQ